MSQSRRLRFSKELAAACIGLGALVGFGQSQVFAQSGPGILSATEVIPSRNVEQSALTHSVYLSADGQLVGQVQILGMVSSRTASGMKVSLLTMDGQAVDTMVDDRGAFAFANVTPGVCAIFGKADGIDLFFQ